MVEHSLRMRGARGSIPLISTVIFYKCKNKVKENKKKIRRKKIKVKNKEKKNKPERGKIKKEYTEKHSCPSGLRGPI